MYNLPAPFGSKLALLNERVLATMPPEDRVREDADDLCGQASWHITTARADLVEMASDCLNHSVDHHIRHIEHIRLQLLRAMMQRTGARPRDSLGRMANDLATLASRAGSYDLDELGDIYCLIEMRLAALLLADIDGKNPEGTRGLFRQSAGDDTPASIESLGNGAPVRPSLGDGR